MPTLYKELRIQLLDYKNAGPKARQTLLDKAIKSINDLPNVIGNKSDAAQAYQVLVYASQLINYAQALRRIENQEFFTIHKPFNSMPRQLAKPAFNDLNEYFEFDPRGIQMRLKKPTTDLPMRIWELFRNAQKQLLSEANITTFNLDELDISNPPSARLFDLNVQMFEKLHYETVERIAPNHTGQFAFTTDTHKHAGSVDDLKTKEAYLHQMLDEHLELEHSTLYQTAATLYKQLDPSLFKVALENCLKDPQFAIISDFKTFRRAFLDGCTHGDNAEILTRLINLIDRHPRVGDEPIRSEQNRRLNSLRAMIQVETFKLHAAYHSAFQFIKKNTTKYRITELTDTQMGGGEHISRSFVLKNPLNNWFAEEHRIIARQLDADHSRRSIQRLTLLEILSKFDQLNSNTLLSVLTSQLVCFKQNTMDFAAVWKSEQYNHASGVLIHAANEAKRLETAASSKRKMALNSEVKKLGPLFHDHERDTRFKPLIRQLLVEVRALVKSGEGDWNQVRAAVTQTITMLNGNFTDQQYKDYEATAQTMYGHTSPYLKPLAVVMLALCGLAITLGLISIATPVLALTSATSAGLFAITGTVSFFKSKPTGIYAAMSDLAATKKLVDKEDLEMRFVPNPI